ncbi:helix-turn-helix protein [Aminicella lysinilytica]|uniref:Helix-turn-helix protein n=2 Tax=Aminicella lysinilytica TaxID=433323 RepID=A0A4R6PZT2_9FIRM|nr:helix-turn-helix protein [Aminicella lysinilytica]
MSKMKTFKEDLNNRMKDDNFRKEYEAIQPELDIIRAMATARKNQNMTQKELADKVGMNQADISKLENGSRNPSLNMLKKLADGLGYNLKLEFVPKSANS